MKRVIRAALLTGGLLALAGWGLSVPGRIDPQDLAGITPDPARGENVFYAAGCASCHAAPDATGEDRLILAGGQLFVSDFGSFAAPNISSDPVHGIGSWGVTDLANALLYGTSPDGRHYYPAFPYASYRNLTLQDIVSLHGFLQTLPADATPSQPHDVGFPFNIRRGLGLWKRLFVRDGWVVTGALTAQQETGRYLVEGPGHCAQCHTPRNALGGLVENAWLSGAPNPSGKGRIPGITPATLTWSEADIAEYLKSGFTPEYDTAGGSMANVIENTRHLSDAQRAAIAAYLKIVPPIAR